MKKSQFASLHAGMMVRASRPVHESMEMTMALAVTPVSLDATILVMR